MPSVGTATDIVSGAPRADTITASEPASADESTFAIALDAAHAHAGGHGAGPSVEERGDHPAADRPRGKPARDDAGPPADEPRARASASGERGTRTDRGSSRRHKAAPRHGESSVSDARTPATGAKAGDAVTPTPAAALRHATAAMATASDSSATSGDGSAAAVDAATAPAPAAYAIAGVAQAIVLPGGSAPVAATRGAGEATVTSPVAADTTSEPVATVDVRAVSDAAPATGVAGRPGAGAQSAGGAPADAGDPDDAAPATAAPERTAGTAVRVAGDAMPGVPAETVDTVDDAGATALAAGHHASSRRGTDEAKGCTIAATGGERATRDAARATLPDGARATPDGAPSEASAAARGERPAAPSRAAAATPIIDAASPRDTQGARTAEATPSARSPADTVAAASVGAEAPRDDTRPNIDLSTGRHPPGRHHAGAQPGNPTPEGIAFDAVAGEGGAPPSGTAARVVGSAETKAGEQVRAATDAAARLSQASGDRRNGVPAADTSPQGGADQAAVTAAAGGARTEAAATPPAGIEHESTRTRGDTAVAASWAERVVESVRVATLRGGGEMRLRLEPAGLGNIDVRISLAHDGVRASIVAEHDTTRALLRNEQHLLHAALERSDLRLAGFSVDVGFGASGNAFADVEQQPRWSGDGGSERPVDVPPEMVVMDAPVASGRLSVRV